MFSQITKKVKITSVILSITLLVGSLSFAFVSFQKNGKKISKLSPVQYSEVSQNAEKAILTLNKSAENIGLAIKKNDVAAVMAIASKSLNQLDELHTEVKAYTKETDRILSDFNSAELDERQAEYKNSIEESFEQAEKMLNAISSNDKTAMKNAEKYVKLLKKINQSL